MTAPILQELLARLPQDAGPRALTIASCTAGAGLLLWLVGARFSRSIFTLVGVAAGAWLGLHVPRWMGWDIDAMAISIGGALALGFAGYLLHMTWVGLTLGTLLASAGIFIAWHRAAGTGDLAWKLPEVNVSAPLNETLRQIWASLPPLLSHVVPVVTASSFVFAALICWRWPKLGRVLAFSLLGSAVLVTGGISAAALAKPEWLAQLPSSTQTQGMALALLVTLGAVVQWMLCPRAPKSIEKNLPNQPARPAARTPRDVRDLGPTSLGPLNLKEARA